MNINEILYTRFNAEFRNITKDLSKVEKLKLFSLSGDDCEELINCFFNQLHDELDGQEYIYVAHPVKMYDLGHHYQITAYLSCSSKIISD